MDRTQRVKPIVHTIRFWVALTLCSLLTVWAATDLRSEPNLSTVAYSSLLKRYVNDEGLVHYASLQREREGLDLFIASAAALDRKVVSAWSNAEQIAFWINLYNAITLKVIIDHYPIRGSGFRSLFYPRNSIRQISGAWDGIRHQVAGREVTLDDIEHKILREKFQEPRIHVALVCAAQSCPPLRQEAYAGSRLDRQFKDQLYRFLRLPDDRGLKVDGQRRGLYISAIFDWFGKDFLATFGDRAQNLPEDHPLARLEVKVRAALLYMSPQLPEEARELIDSKRFRVRYLDYDWKLNEQPPSDKK